MTLLTRPHGRFPILKSLLIAASGSLLGVSATQADERPFPQQVATLLGSSPTQSAADNSEQGDATDDIVPPLYLQPVVNPADKAAERAQTQPVDPRRPVSPFAAHVASYDMPAVEVVGEKLPELREEDRIGPYAQPRWTARRFTPGTRVYVRPPGTIELEYWLRPTIEKDGNTEIRTLYEIGIGLPYRFQVDFYIRTDSAGDSEPTNVGQQVEVRWAFADWGKIWGNPTIYVEWVQKEGGDPDQIEIKMLFGDEISPRWHWGVNLVAELETGGQRTYEYQVTGGLTYALVDSLFSVGVEFQYIFADVHDDRGNFSNELFIGPTIQWRPFEQLRIAFAPLVGATNESPTFRAYLNVGWEF